MRNGLTSSFPFAFDRLATWLLPFWLCAAWAPVAVGEARVTPAELQKALKTDSALVVDVRPYDEYLFSHPPGAVSVGTKPGTKGQSLDAYVSKIGTLALAKEGKDTPIILYCSGPHCGQSNRLEARLSAAGYSNVRRYQLPPLAWRAIGGVMKMGISGIRYVAKGERPAVFVDAREPEAFHTGSLSGAHNIPRSSLDAEDPGADANKAAQLPDKRHLLVMVFGENADQARGVAEHLAKNANYNVFFSAMPYAEIAQSLSATETAKQ